MVFVDAKEAGTDNRNIVDDGKSQKLTRDDIETLKEQGLKGQVTSNTSAITYKHLNSKVFVLFHLKTLQYVSSLLSTGNHSAAHRQQLHFQR